MKLSIILFLACFTSYGYAQIASTQDSVESQCDKVFTRCEEPPSIKKGIAFYQKLLTNYLKEKKQFPTSGSAILTLIISNTGKVIEIKSRESTVNNIEGLVSAMETFSNVWRPGRQYNRVVCSYIRMKINVSRNKLKIDYY